jgi:putative aldouronate transport system substrate-binding protein
MFKVKKVLCLAMVIVFALACALTGCGSAKDAGAEGTAADQPAAVQSTAGEPAVTEKEAEAPKEVVEITYIRVGDKQPADTDLVMGKVNEYLKDFGLKLKLQVFGWGDYDTKVNPMLASGEPFDVCFTANWAANYYMNAPAGYFLKLNDYLEKDPTIANILGKDFLNGAAIDGVNYAVQTHKETAHTWGYLLQKSLVDKYNIDVTKIKTNADLAPYFQQILDGEGGKIVPLLACRMDTPFHFLDWNNFSDDNVPGALYPDNRDTKVIDQFLAPESIAYYKEMRDFYQKGYIAKDNANLANTAEEMKTGKYFATEQPLIPYFSARMSQQTGIEWVQVEMTKPVMSNRETTGAMLAIPAASKHPDEAFKFITLTYTDAKLRNMITFGLEDTHYKVNADGRISMTQKGTDGWNLGNQWEFGDQFKDLLLDSQPLDLWTKMTEFNDSALVEQNLGFAFNASPVQSEIAACKAVIDNYFPMLFSGSADVDKTVAKMEKELKASGEEKVLDEMQKQFDAWRVKVGK